jgi:hypothetical protein
MDIASSLAIPDRFCAVTDCHYGAIMSALNDVVAQGRDVLRNELVSECACHFESARAIQKADNTTMSVETFCTEFIDQIERDWRH